MIKFYIKIIILIFAVSLFNSNNLFAGFFSRSKKITVTGSTTVLPISQRCAEVYMKKNGGVNISISGGGSSVGFAALIDNNCDIADASRSIKQEETDKAKSKGVVPFEYVIAKDALAIIINKKVTGITNITIDQLKNIYLGKIKNWKELGGSDGQIVIVSRDTSSGTFETFESLVMKKEKIIQEALMLASNNAIASTISTTPNSIGYVGLGYLNSAEFNVLKVEDVIPNKSNVLKGKYKLSRDLYMYTNNQATGNVKRFIDFILSNEGQKIVDDEGFVPLK